LEEKQGLCLDCVKDKYLKSFIRNSEKCYMECCLCNKNKDCVLIEENEALTDLIRALIRFHYPEHIYNHHWGGLRGANHLFYHDNEIIEPIKDSDDFLDYLVGGLDTEEKIDLYYGRHDDFGRGCFWDCLKNSKSTQWDKYSTALGETNHYELENEFSKLISQFTKYFEYTLEENNVFNRARIGNNETFSENDDNLVKQTMKEPYSHDDISAPKPKLSGAGRANRSGVSYLYLASQLSTAIAEIRPSPGHYISVGKFKNKRSLRVADFRQIKLELFTSSEEQLDKFRFLLDISEAFSNPVLPDERNGYLLTHFISDILRRLNFDGILYESAISDGYNGVFFTVNDFEYIEDSSIIVNVETVKYTYKKLEYCKNEIFDYYDEKLKPI
jgi:hypothetical protein